MADNQVQRRQPIYQQTWIWMILALVLVSGFLAWLAVESEPTSVAVVEEEEVEEDPATPTVATDVFAAGPEDYAGQALRLRDLRVSSVMSARTVWIDLPTGQPYLVKLEPAALDEGVTLGSGDVMTVAGTVRLMSDSVIAAWRTEGTIQDDGQAAQAQFATSFLEASQAQRTGTASSDGGAD